MSRQRPSALADAAHLAENGEAFASEWPQLDGRRSSARRPRRRPSSVPSSAWTYGIGLLLARPGERAGLVLHLRQFRPSGWHPPRGRPRFRCPEPHQPIRRRSPRAGCRYRQSVLLSVAVPGHLTGITCRGNSFPPTSFMHRQRLLRGASLSPADPGTRAARLQTGHGRVSMAPKTQPAAGSCSKSSAAPEMPGSRSGRRHPFRSAAATCSFILGREGRHDGSSA